jgi:hypothetical protein
MFAPINNRCGIDVRFLACKMLAKRVHKNHRCSDSFCYDIKNLLELLTEENA